MTPHEFHTLRKTVDTPSGRIAFIEKGDGPAALFVHGVPLNGYHWRHAIGELADLRRCVAPDLMGLGYSKVGPDQKLDFEAQAQMLLEFLDALGIETVDLVGNDSGGAVAQILDTTAPGRIRSLTLTNCDTHDNWPPEAFLPIVKLGKAGHFGQALAGLLANPDAARSAQGLGVGFEFPERLFAGLGMVRGIMETDGSPAARRASRAVVILLIACSSYPFYTCGLRNQIMGLAGNIATMAVAVWVCMQIGAARRLLVIAPLAVAAWVAFATFALINEARLSAFN
jgi:pimeloyl-ACP methyl ester carboxylesterase